MEKNINLAYHKEWLKNKAKVDSLQQSQRALFTIRKFFTHILRRNFTGKVLDLGCGDASFVECCHRESIDAEGIDIIDGINFEHDALPYADHQFDIVMMYSLIEHLRDPSNILNEIKRVITNNGIVLIITPNLDAVKLGFFDDPSHVRPYNPRSLVWLMSLFGFEKVFVGLWTVKKSPIIWKLPQPLQFLYGRMLPFCGLTKFVPVFLKGKSKSILAAFCLRSEL